MKPLKAVFETWSVPIEDVKANDYDMFESHRPEHAEEILRLNPSAIILRYLNCQVIFTTHSDYQMFVDNDWLIKDPQGRYAIPKGTDNPGATFFFGDADVQAWVAAEAIKLLQGTDFTGLFGDLLGQYRVRPAYTFEDEVQLYDPRTNQPYTNTAWRDDMIALIQTIKATLDPLGQDLLGNCVGNADPYYSHKANADIIFAELPKLAIEGAFGFKGQNNRTKENWLKNIQLIREFEGKTLLVFQHDLRSDPTEDPDRYALFVYCSLMMNGPNPLHYWRYLNKEYQDGPYWTGLIDLDPGAPLEDITQVETNLYRREYENATFFVNPHPTESTITYGLAPKSGFIIKRGNEWSFEYKNEDDTPFEVVRRTVVISDETITIAPGETRTISVGPNQILVNPSE